MNDLPRSALSLRPVAGTALHYPQRLAVRSDDPRVGEVCRTQTLAKAELVLRALALLERFERGELAEVSPPVQAAPSGGGVPDWRAFEALYLPCRTVYREGPVTLPDAVSPPVRAFYDRYGLCSFGNFLFTVDPFEWQDAYRPWFVRLSSGNRALDPDGMYPFLRTAFGDVFYGCGRQLGFVSVQTGVSSALGLDFYLNVTLTEEDVLRDLYFRGIFDEVSGKEQLSPATCLGFLPPVALGGEITAGHAHVVDLRTHLAFLAGCAGLFRDADLEPPGP